MSVLLSFFELFSENYFICSNINPTKNMYLTSHLAHFVAPMNRIIERIFSSLMQL